MVLADSHGISRAPCYLGYSPGGARISVTGLSPSTAGLSRPFTYTMHSLPTGPAEPARKVPQPRPCNARRLSHMDRFSLFRVRSPLLTESLLFSLPAGTEMFHFPAFPPRTLCVQVRVTTFTRAPWRGFPIRTPWDHRSVINSPRLIADSYVLLRLLMPRHPPCALKNLTTKDQIKLLERTMKHTTTTPPKEGRKPDPGSYFSKKLLLYKDARVHYVVLKQQPRTTHPHHPHPSDTRPSRSCAGNQKHTTPPPPPRTRADVANDCPCCLRTQQCAKHHPPPPTTPNAFHPTPKGADRTSIRDQVPRRHLFR